VAARFRKEKQDKGGAGWSARTAWPGRRDFAGWGFPKAEIIGRGMEAGDLAERGQAQVDRRGVIRHGACPFPPFHERVNPQPRQKLGAVR